MIKVRGQRRLQVGEFVSCFLLHLGAEPEPEWDLLKNISEPNPEVELIMWDLKVLNIHMWPRDTDGMRLLTFSDNELLLLDHDTHHAPNTELHSWKLCGCCSSSYYYYCIVKPVKGVELRSAETHEDRI